MRPLLRIAALLAAATVATAPAEAAAITWVDWTGSSLGVTTGSASGFAGAISVNYSGELRNLLSGYPSYQPTSTWAGGLVGNAPNPHQIIQLFGGDQTRTDTVTFSKPVRDPVFAIWSLGQSASAAEFAFNATPVLDAGGPSAEYGGNGLSVSGNTVLGLEGNGSLHLNGNYSSISFTTPIYENWYGFTVGTPVPEPASLAVLGAGLLGLAAVRRRKRS